jgi:hypothetical protein
MKILIHKADQKLYLPIISAIAEDKSNIVMTGSLHGNAFDTFNQVMPDMVILPIYEYTQELHELVNAFKDKSRFALFMGDVNNDSLIDYCNKNNIMIISKESKKQFKLPNHITYDYLYDSNLFSNKNLQRNDKLLVILSSNNDTNHKKLDNLLYPHTKSKLCLINNPDFEHAQNIGMANELDISHLMNTYGSLIDIDNNYIVEAKVCGIKNIELEDSVPIGESKEKTLDIDINKCDAKYFVQNKLLPIIQGK